MAHTLWAHPLQQFKHISPLRWSIGRAIFKQRKRTTLEFGQYDNAVLLLNKIMYAISAWYGFLNKRHILQINSLLKRAFKYGYVKSVYNLEQFLQDYDDNLFTKATHENHSMHE